MANELTADQQFQDKMRERMRQAMGDLMPDAVLAGIVAKGIQEAFFTRQMKKDPSSWRSEEREYPSWIVEFLQQECRNQVAVAVQNWIRDNPGKFEDTVKEVMGKNMASAVLGAFNALLAPAFDQLRSNISTAVANIR